MTNDKALTKNEKEIMKLLWSVDRPLSSSEIVNLSEDKTWKESYIHLIINSLLKKEMIKIDGFVKTTKNYARTFVPVLSKEDYLLNLIIENNNFKPEYIPIMVRGLLNTTDDKKIISEVQAIVKNKIKH